ncbi:MAG: molecular chaperone HtpG [Bacilli bacterium]
MAEIKQFKTESKRLLELMINSIYTNKEIFLRELISNASDAIDKYHYLSLTEEVLPKKNDYEIFLSFDKEVKTITIKDNGIGMTYQELNDSLGTIAKSGSIEFLEKMKANNAKDIDINIIGQFGVGFYSAFMVASQVDVKTRSLYDEKGYLFSSTGADTYEVSDIDKEDSGTEIVLHLRDNNDDFEFDQFLDEWKLKSLVKKYSDYVRYPIRMNVHKSVPVEGEKDKYEETVEVETLNSMTPLWKKQKGDITEEELNEFYKQKYYDYENPLLNIQLNVEGAMEYTALLFIPKKAPYNLYSEKYEKGLQLYSKGVFIMDKCKELLPDYLRFVKGLIDSSDLSLNISRELLQKSKQLTDIAKNVEKKIVSRLEGLLKNDYDKYLEFFKAFGVNLKFGIYDDFGLKKDMLQDLIIYNTVNQEKMITLKDYVAHMKDKQKYIYYASGKNKASILALPQMDLLKQQGYDVLMLTDDVDEFAINVMQEYDKKQFKSINQGDLDLLDKKEEKKLKELEEQKKPLLDKLKEILKDEVTDVVLSKRLTDSAVCLVSSDGVSFEMEKVIANMPNQEKPKATKILEINPNHDLFQALEKIFYDNPLELADYADLLYAQALLIEGFELKDPVDFAKKMSNLIIKTIK